MKIIIFLEIYNKNMENLPFYCNISMEIGTLGKVSCIYGDMLEIGVIQVKYFQTCNIHGGQGVTAVDCYVAS
jgi:hypothetical protein